MNEIKWRTVKSFPTPIEAEVARTKLESEGIECFIRDQHTISVNVLYSQALGGVRLDVKEEDYEQARQSLEEVVVAAEPERCGKCGNTNIITKDASWRWAYFLFFVIHVPLPFMKRKKVCGSCGAEFTGN